MDFTNRTVGLYTEVDAVNAVAYFRRLIPAHSYTPGGLFTEASNEVQGFIRAQVIPMEWKGYEDNKLDLLIYVDHSWVPSTSGWSTVELDEV